uniref:Uncharacterized protein n=1 Tax=Arundo donax TaxID=35708 RepID=A0A0A9BW97_ARUDO
MVLEIHVRTTQSMRVQSGEVETASWRMWALSTSPR